MIFDTEQGQNPIHPKTLIKVALFAIHNCRFSLRKMESDTALNLAYRWLTGDRTIDHSTIGKFLSRYRHIILDLFSQTVLICVEKELVDFEVLAIDSIKVRANASYKQHKTLAAIEKERKKIEEKLEALPDEAAVSNEIKAEEAILKNRKQRLEAAAGLLEQRNGEKNPSYSITTTTDTKSDIITNIQVNEKDNDAGALLPAIEGSEQRSGERHNVVLADPAFSSIENLEKLEEHNIDALIPDRRMEVEGRNKLSKGEYDRSKFSCQSETNAYICPAGEQLEKSGETTINGRRYDKYTNTAACGGCAHKTGCTKIHVRIIYRDQNEEVKERMREKFEEEENKELYKKRAHTSESPYGHIKHNLIFRILNNDGN